MIGRKWAIMFVLPALAFYLFVVLVPSLRGVVFAFTDWSGLSPERNWVGLLQFRRVFENSDSSGALKHTVFIAIGITILQNLVGLLIALGLHTQVKSRNILRTMFFAPAIVAPVATAYLWQYMFAPTGPINSLFVKIGLEGFAQDWLGNPEIVLWSIIIVIIWQFAGYSMVIYLAGLEGVPQEIIEAAEIDGASYWRKVTLMLSIIGGFKLFDQVYILTGGGPGQASQTISTLMYRNAFQFGEFAYSTALAVLLTLVVAAFSSIQYFMITKTDKS
jgi:raffinose/stachyose/melibiose transport system permease protein